MSDQPGSILDKIIASKEDQEKSQFDPVFVISQLLQTVSEKESDVLKRRFGLADQPKETLEAIGASYSVTRERIRQIENLAIKKIKDHGDFAELIRPIEHVIGAVLESAGGVMNEEHLLDDLFPTGRSQAEDQSTLFMIAELLDNRFKKISANNHFEKSWRTIAADMDFVKETIGVMVATIKELDQPMVIEELYEEFKQTEFFSQHENALQQDVVLAWLYVSHKVAENPFNEFGLRKWGSVAPKRMNDKIYLVLKKIGKPMHFVDIAKKITDVFGKEAYPPTVHNELILNKHYVLVGRGIYALKEWGYKRGVVADVIEDILRDSKEPLSRKQIVEAVLEQRIVKKNTIHLALTNKERFNKLSDGRYMLTAANEQA